MDTLFDSKHKVISTIVLIIVIIVAISVLVGGNDATDSQTTPEFSKSVVYICESANAMEVGYGNDLVQVRLSDQRQFTLEEKVSASGDKYATENDSEVFWVKGENAYFEESGTKSYNNCVEANVR